MDILHRCCAGGDVHKKSVVVCIRRVDDQGKVHREIRTFGTFTRDLLALADWLAAAGVTHVAMESTSVYWKPVFNILEGQFRVILVNARHIKQVPGRKTDIKDCEWIAQLLQHGLLKASFIPPQPVRELRDLTRQRTQLVNERAAVANRIQKVLEDANIKLASVAADVLGTSGRAMLEAIVAGEDSPEELADLARRRLRSKIPELQLALQGRVTAHHRFVLGTLLDHIQHLEAVIQRFSTRLEEVLGPFDQSPEKELGQAVERLKTIPGVDQRAAEIIVAEIGPNMEAFATDGHLASWAGMCPGNNESAGKRRSGKTTKGSRWLRALLVQAAWGASRTKRTYMAAQYRQLARRRGRKRALVAVGHTILIIAYHLLNNRSTYADLGPNFFDRLDPERLTKSLVKRLEKLGHRVKLEPKETAA
jgi:transposase